MALHCDHRVYPALSTSRADKCAETSSASFRVSSPCEWNVRVCFRLERRSGETPYEDYAICQHHCRKDAGQLGRYAPPLVILPIMWGIRADWGLRVEVFLFFTADVVILRTMCNQLPIRNVAQQLSYRSTVESSGVSVALSICFHSSDI